MKFPVLKPWIYKADFPEQPHGWIVGFYQPLLILKILCILSKKETKKLNKKLYLAASLKKQPQMKAISLYSGARARVFFIGFKTNRLLIPDLEQMMAPYKSEAQTVRKVLSILDRAGTGNNKGLCKAKITLTPKPVMRKSPYAGMLFNGLGRPTKLDGYSATLPASMGGNKTPIIDELELYENEKSWVEAYHKGLLEGKAPSEFREAPKRLRRLTYQEAALLQTFPVDYKWMGSQSSIFRQIGNAVPCNLGYSVGKLVMDCLLQDEVDKLMIALPIQLEIADGHFN